MPFPRSSSAMAWARNVMPIFEIRYGALPAARRTLTGGLIITMCPDFRSRMAGSTARGQRNAPRTFTSITRSNLPGGHPATSAQKMAPALLIKMSMRPNSRSVASARRWTSSNSRTLVGTGSARRPNRPTSSAVSWIVPGSRACGSAVLAATTMSAPSRASASATALPTPREAPVAIATRPSSLPMYCSLAGLVQTAALAGPKRRSSLPREGNAMQTFTTSDVEGGKQKWPCESLARAFEYQLGRPVEACAASQRDLVEFQCHPLIAEVDTAFQNHLPIVLSPDDVWLAIVHGAGVHIRENAEALRSRFFAWSGKKTIKVRRDEFVKGSPHNDWPGCFAEFSDAIAGFIGKKRDLFVGAFSTTGAVEKAAQEVALMSAMSRFFDFRVITRCGIPEITLLGTTEDWESIRVRARVLAEFDLEW